MIGKKYLKGGQVKLDANKDGKISAADFSMLRKGMKKYQEGGKQSKKSAAAKKRLEDLAIQREMARDEYGKALKNRTARLKELEGKTSDGANAARENLNKEVTRTWNNFKIARGHGNHSGGESQENGQYEMKISRKNQGIRKGFKMDEKKGATELKKYQEGGKASDMESRKERMYLEIRKDAERMEKEMKRQGMSQEEINKKLDAYMEKAMKDAQYSTNMKKGKVVKYQEGGKQTQTYRKEEGRGKRAARRPGARVENGVIYGDGYGTRKKKYPGKIVGIKENENGTGYTVTTYGGAVNPENLKQAMTYGHGKRAAAKKAAATPGSRTEAAKQERVDSYQEGGKTKSAKKERNTKLTGKEDPAKLDPKKRAEFIRKYAQKKKKVVKYQNGGKTEAAKSEREQLLADVRENSQQMARERALMQKVKFAKKRAEQTGAADWYGNFSQEEMDMYHQIQENGMTQELPKPYRGKK